MILIADSGSTKTDWSLIKGSCIRHQFTTQGINPFHQSSTQIEKILSEEVIPAIDTPISEIHFYGAGCTPEKSVILKDSLQKLFSDAITVEVNSDLLGAARALCGRQPGIVCILGTGSNSCYYTGKQIVNNTPALGYILGDEGSGAYLGKRLVSDCLKKQLPEDICNSFLQRFNLTQADIIEKVYRQPLPNRFLAGLSRFLAENREKECIHQLLVDCFNDFIQRNLLVYPIAPLYFTGSISHYYSVELKEAADRHGLCIASIAERPMEGLIAYHSVT